MGAEGPLVVALGAALSANKGAASMLQAVVDHVDDIASGARIVSLSTYPDDDRSANRNGALEIVSYTPMQMVFPTLPLAVLIFVSRLLGFSGRGFALTEALRALMNADAVADIAGISFVDGRGLATLLYNTLMTGIPLLVGAKIVKVSQALGPFQRRSTQLAASLVLPRLETIIARGPTTASHLVDFGLDNVVEGADVAFLMEVREEHESAAIALRAGRDASYVAVSPSSVVDAIWGDRDDEYATHIAGLCDFVVDELEKDVVIVAHSARTGHGESRMNDLPLCREIHGRVQARERVQLVDASLDPAVLRSLIGKAEALVTSRFHAMISGLATLTPVVVVGWSHKYHEVMAEFSLDRFVISHDEYRPESAAGLVTEAVERTDSISELIDMNLARVVDSSRRSLDAIRQTVNG